MAPGTLILVSSQVFSMCFRWLITNGKEVVRQAGVHRWVLEIIAYFDQLGFLIITPLMPILLWPILDREFINKLWVEMVMAGDKKKSADS
jgi:TRAP-type mannitol/chloroaromatic compound transport system permease large subunit